MVIFLKFLLRELRPSYKGHAENKEDTIEKCLLGVAEDRFAPKDILEPRSAEHGEGGPAGREGGFRRRRRARSSRVGAPGMMI